MCISNVNDRRAAIKEYSVVLAAHDRLTSNSDNITNRTNTINSVKYEYE